MSTSLTLLVAELVNAREEAGITQRQLGERLGVIQNTVDGWENGRSTPKVAGLILWADALGYDLMLKPRKGKQAPVRGLRSQIRRRPGKRKAATS